MPITTEPDTAETPDNFDSSIPVLTDVIVPGRPDRARTAPRAPEPVIVARGSRRRAMNTPTARIATPI